MVFFLPLKDLHLMADLHRMSTRIPSTLAKLYLVEFEQTLIRKVASLFWGQTLSPSLTRTHKHPEVELMKSFQGATQLSVTLEAGFKYGWNCKNKTSNGYGKRRRHEESLRLTDILTDLVLSRISLLTKFFFNIDWVTTKWSKREYWTWC